MKQLSLAFLMILALGATACGTTTNSSGVASGVAVGSVCNDASKNACSADKKSVLTCNTATKKYVATECSAGTACDATTTTCKASGGTDTTSGNDVTGGADATSGDTTTTPEVSVVDGGNTDTTTAPDTTKTDTTTTPDTTLPPQGGECAPTDQQCLSKCQFDKCGAEAKACSTDADCIALNNCLLACKDAACQQKCLTEAKPATAAKMTAVSACMVEKCVKKTEFTGKCAQTDEACLNQCLVAKCSAEGAACDAEPDCNNILKCFGTCGGADQACVQKCFADGSPAGQAALQAVTMCLQSECIQ